MPDSNSLNNFRLTKIVLVTAVALFSTFMLYGYISHEPMEASATWWNTDWQHYRTIIIDNNSYTSNYQLLINVSYSSSDNTSATPSIISCFGHCNANFSDLRFVQIDNSTLLSYFIEKKVDSNYALVWINLSAQAISDEKILMYYGNSGASEYSDGNATFIFYEDFPTTGDPTGDTWLKDGSGSVDVASSSDALHGNMCKVIGGGGTVEKLYTSSNFSYPLRYHYRFKFSSAGSGIYMYAGLKDEAGGDSFIYTNIYSDTSLHEFYLENAGSKTHTDSDTAWTSYHIVDLAWYSGHAYFNIDNGAETKDLTSNVPTADMNIHFGADKDSSDYIVYVDYVFIAKYANPEPSWSSFGAEQNQSTKSWHTIASWSGSIYSTAIWSAVATILGSITNISSWKEIEKWQTGSIYNTSNWNIISSISGNINSISSWNTIVSMNGDITNISNWQLAQSINGNLYNTSIWNTISSINGDIDNISSWNLVQSINGNIINTSTAGWILIDSINGDLSNMSSWLTTQSINGLLNNNSAWHNVAMFNGTLKNISKKWNTASDWQGSLVNTSAVSVASQVEIVLFFILALFAGGIGVFARSAGIKMISLLMSGLFFIILATLFTNPVFASLSALFGVILLLMIGIIGWRLR